MQRQPLEFFGMIQARIQARDLFITYARYAKNISIPPVINLMPKILILYFQIADSSIITLRFCLYLIYLSDFLFVFILSFNLRISHPPLYFHFDGV